jgi:hypothetical protein
MDTIDTVPIRTVPAPQTVNSVKSVCRQYQSKEGGGSLPTDKCIADPFAQALAALERRCPDHVGADRWQQAIDDGRQFLAKWGDKAAALGWTARDLFGLHTPPAQPHPSYQRLSRYDQAGLVWLLCGQPVVALTATSAAIESPTRAICVYRKKVRVAQ